jgi:hypothetical protein
VELNNTIPVEILGKNKQQELMLKYFLSSVPEPKWALFFNSRPTPYSIKVVTSVAEAFIIVTAHESKLLIYNPEYDPDVEPIVAEAIVSSEIKVFLTEYIEQIDAEHESSVVKEDILKVNYTPGMIIVHNSLFDIDDTNLYKDYIKRVSDRIYI